jgi:arylformamidase
MNETLKLTTITAKAESPALHPKPKNIDLHVWVGANERPVFIEQAGFLATKWKSTLTLEPSRHHFDVIEGLEDPNSPLINVLLEKN